MKAFKANSKLLLSGSCTLSDDELAEQYNLDKLSDEELASVNLDRKSLINDYRYLHELSEQKKTVKEPELELNCLSENDFLRERSIKELIDKHRSICKPDQEYTMTKMPFGLSKLVKVEDMPASANVPKYPFKFNDYGHCFLINYVHKVVMVDYSRLFQTMTILDTNKLQTASVYTPGLLWTKCKENNNLE
ncbi:uncharacterized protein LOC124460452 [Drosophila willistoni]|uniref:uncharacterized protein LOC124460452 n=1 Tax=Drosophila willistoni TaxID=7260 RepID=UPI00017D70AB|nr:uncharacterized protein LOC124460452 [Drosophila willistoni]